MAFSRLLVHLDFVDIQGGQPPGYDRPRCPRKINPVFMNDDGRGGDNSWLKAKERRSTLFSEIKGSEHGWANVDIV